MFHFSNENIKDSKAGYGCLSAVENGNSHWLCSAVAVCVSRWEEGVTHLLFLPCFLFLLFGLRDTGLKIRLAGFHDDIQGGYLSLIELG